jgi:predicted O-methyltransferase YrrM
MGHVAQRVLRPLGYQLVRVERKTDGSRLELPPDFSPEEAATYREVAPHTMTSPERIQALTAATYYVVHAGVPGAIVECGVWRGGSMMAVARTLKQLGVTDRELFLFDTFEGMTDPTEEDRMWTGGRASELLSQHGREERIWGVAPLDVAKRNVLGVGYDPKKIRFVKGPVERTLPDAAPAQIALLRLDTDWYASTKHELEQLFPRLSPGGILIIDDYGHWLGARQATDEYIAEHDISLLLNRIDYTARIAVKP